MIVPCRDCRQPLRDCTGWRQDGFIRVPAPGWYHTATGREEGADGHLAVPAALVSIWCPVHGDRPEELCTACCTAAEVGLHLHNAGRCVPDLCLWAHS